MHTWISQFTEGHAFKTVLAGLYLCRQSQCVSLVETNNMSPRKTCF